MQTIHLRTLQNAKAQPVEYRPRLPSAPFGAQRSLIALNSFKTS
jgi:hypothetical protein